MDDGVLVLDVLDNAADQPVGTLGCCVDGDELERSQWLGGRHFVWFAICVIEKQKSGILVRVTGNICSRPSSGYLVKTLCDCPTRPSSCRALTSKQSGGAVSTCGNDPCQMRQISPRPAETPVTVYTLYAEIQYICIPVEGTSVCSVSVFGMASADEQKVPSPLVPLVGGEGRVFLECGGSRVRDLMCFVIALIARHRPEYRSPSCYSTTLDLLSQYQRYPIPTPHLSKCPSIVSSVSSQPATPRQS